MFGAPQQQDLYSVDETRLIGRIMLLVIYLFLGSLLSLTVVTSVFASGSPNIVHATYDQDSDNRISYAGAVE